MFEFIKTYAPQLIIAGIKYTIPLALISFVIALVLAAFVGVLRSYKPQVTGIKRALWFTLDQLLAFYVWAFRSTPMLVQLFVVFYGLPKLGIAWLQPSAWIAAIAVLSLNSGAYASEAIRAAISSIPDTQREAAEALGMTDSQTFIRIILPQAARISIPTLANSFISLIKDTSLASTVTIVEMFYLSQQLAAATFEPLQMYLLVAAIYAIFVTILSIPQRYIQRWADRFVK
ncbi:cystine ABC transporter (permease) [Weissella viridescens]|jgi:cystine transport system permease protein|uniref:Amino acid ABC transporter permease component n=1 Tax=Weissella viridescens TaxID=1629 RepID=A0A0R2H0A1_WEIVI|nr:amino acid ABC transporter permease [Weissella viridescens]KRN46303.1 amino acid ABC transporter permease component [Weissella viridescens]MBX4173177.1 amino acid ABC transporter permease [Weissella viridescens]MCB6840493.1 amino acid ABC transporter permease [Weissella viridescens]MCB6847226.1 amino acid ABC transporter permease [Weissella viridescens]QOD86082.1 amino acid ABC transporter permease [Weissella viridescens]